MPVKNPFRLYLRSRLNITLSIIGGSLIVLSLVLFGSNGLLSAALLLVVYAAVTALLFYSRRGAREVVAESEEDRQKRIREKIDGYARTRERIAVLRIGDEKVGKAVEYFLLESGEYLQKCRELSSYSPQANERIERVLEICQVFLGELDESSTALRYNTAPRGAAESREDFSARTAGDVMECASLIKERALRDLEGVSEKERLAIMKELENGK
jgi:hypothetical protein